MSLLIPYFAFIIVFISPSLYISLPLHYLIFSVRTKHITTNLLTFTYVFKIPFNPNHIGGQTRFIKVLEINGRSKLAAHALWKTVFYFKFAASVDLNRCLQQIKLPSSLHTPCLVLSLIKVQLDSPRTKNTSLITMFHILYGN